MVLGVDGKHLAADDTKIRRAVREDGFRLREGKAEPADRFLELVGHAWVLAGAILRVVCLPLHARAPRHRGLYRGARAALAGRDTRIRAAQAPLPAAKLRAATLVLERA